jgi:hypothetical protein
MEERRRQIQQEGTFPELQVVRTYLLFGRQVYESEESREAMELNAEIVKLIPEHGIKVTELWELYRSYVIREDTLINDRFSRLTTIQGFLIVAYGGAAAAFGKTFMDFLSNCMAGPQGGLIWYLRCAEPSICGSFALLTAILGALSTYHARDAILAAEEALEKLRTDWERYSPASERLGIPGLQGAGSVLIHDRGHRHATSLPSYMGVVWAAVGLITSLALFLAVYAGLRKLIWGLCW